MALQGGSVGKKHLCTSPLSDVLPGIPLARPAQKAEGVRLWWSPCWTEARVRMEGASEE